MAERERERERERRMYQTRVSLGERECLVADGLADGLAPLRGDALCDRLQK